MPLQKKRTKGVRGMIVGLAPLSLDRLPQYYLKQMREKMTKTEKKMLGRLSSMPKSRRDLERETGLSSNVIYRALIKLVARGYAKIYEGRPEHGKERLTHYFTLSDSGNLLKDERKGEDDGNRSGEGEEVL
jgi:DNA-binding PadR family transcriptional regulator